MPAGFMLEFEAGAYSKAFPVAHRFPEALGAFGAAVEPEGIWLCAGNSLMFNV